MIDILNAIPIVVYAYTCHPNVLPIFLELKNANHKRMNKVLTRAIGLSLFMYLLLGAFVYLTFKNQLAHSNGNFLQNDYHADASMLIASIGMSVSITMAIPLFVNAFRGVAFTVLQPCIDEGKLSFL